MAHFAQLWPLDAEAVRSVIAAESRERIISVEGNASGQLATVLRGAGMLGECEVMGRYDGLPLLAEEIADEVRS